MNEVCALREHALYVNDGRFWKMAKDTAAKALNQSSMDLLELPCDVTCPASDSAPGP